MARRVTRKMLKEDEFVTIFDECLHWAQANWRPVAWGVGALAAVVLLWWGAATWLGGRSQDASYLLYRAVSAAEGTAEAPGSPEAAEPLFKEVVDRHGGSGQADVARLYLARIELGRGQTETARAALQELAGRRAGTAVGRMATFDLMMLRVASGQTAEVAAELQAMVTAAAPELPRDTALYELGMLLLREDKPAEAKPHLERLVEEFPESPYRFPAQQRLQELG